MATTVALGDYVVNPTENDVYGNLSTGYGRVLQEVYFAQLVQSGYVQHGRCVSGFVLPTSGSRTDATITAGEAVLGGYLVKSTADITVTFADASRSWIWLVLAKTDSKVTTAQLYIDVGATVPTRPTEPYLFLGYVDVAAGSVTGASDGRICGRMVFGRFDGTGFANFGSGDWTGTKDATGEFTISVAAGVFLKTPTAIVSVSGAAGPGFIMANPVSALNTNVYTYTIAGAASDRAFSFVLFG